MHELLRRLTTEHVELQQALAGIRPRQFRTDEGRNRLDRVRSLFRSHVQTEQEQLYPPIEQAARTDARLAGQLQRLTDDLRIVTGLAEDFFSKYENAEPQLVEFATDHGALLTILRIRLKREEETIFPLFDRLMN
ncbi:MAG: hemerythrin domain-containing protein [candidate division WOR-3 bacterium]